MERKMPFWIKGNPENPDGVILALFHRFPLEFDRGNPLAEILFNPSSGFRDNAGNEGCIFYYDEGRTEGARIRLLDECDSIQREWITASTEWKEIKPLGKDETNFIKIFIKNYFEFYLKNNQN